jgi:hypothetical protein
VPREEASKFASLHPWNWKQSRAFEEISYQLLKDQVTACTRPLRTSNPDGGAELPTSARASCPSSQRHITGGGSEAASAQLKTFLCGPGRFCSHNPRTWSSRNYGATSRTTRRSAP